MTSAISTLSRKRQTYSEPSIPGRPSEKGKNTQGYLIVVDSWATSLPLPLEFEYLLRMSDQIGQLIFDWLIPVQPIITSSMANDEDEIPFRPIPPKSIREAQARYEFHGRGKPPIYPPDEE